MDLRGLGLRIATAGLDDPLPSLDRSMLRALLLVRPAEDEDDPSPGDARLSGRTYVPDEEGCCVVGGGDAGRCGLL